MLYLANATFAWVSIQSNVINESSLYQGKRMIRSKDLVKEVKHGEFPEFQELDPKTVIKIWRRENT